MREWKCPATKSLGSRSLPKSFPHSREPSGSAAGQTPDKRRAPPDVQDQTIRWLAEGAAVTPPGMHRRAQCLNLRRRVGANHRQLSTYLNALARRRLHVEEATEPLPPAAWTGERPEAGTVPTFLVARCVRA